MVWWELSRELSWVCCLSHADCVWGSGVSLTEPLSSAQMKYLAESHQVHHCTRASLILPCQRRRQRHHTGDASCRKHSFVSKTIRILFISSWSKRCSPNTPGGGKHGFPPLHCPKYLPCTPLLCLGLHPARLPWGAGKPWQQQDEAL